MNTNLKAALVATGLALPLAAPAFADMDDFRTGEEMLKSGLSQQLDDYGIETDNMMDLTLAEVAEIRGILADDSGSDQVKKQSLEEIVNG